MASPPEVKVRICARPGCLTTIKPGQLACRSHWFELPSGLRDRLVYTWEQRKAHPDVPELVHAHRSMLLECLRAWGVPVELARAALSKAPSAASESCAWCGGVGGKHLDECDRPRP